MLVCVVVHVVVQFFPSFSFVSYYGNESETKENQNRTGFKIFKLKKNLSHNMYKESL